MDSIIVRDNKKPGLKALCSIFVVFALLVQIFCLLAFLTGITSIYGKTFTIPNAIEIVFEIFYLNGNWLKAICGGAMVLMFVGFLITIIKNLVESISLIKKITAEDSVSNPSTKNVVLTFGSKTGEACTSIISFVICCNFFGVSKYTLNTYIVLVCWALVILFARIIYSAFEKFTLDSIFTKLGYDLITVVGMSILVLFAKYPSIDLAIYSIKGIVIDFGQCLVSLILPVLYFIIAVVVLKMMNSANSCSNLHTYDLRSDSKCVLVCSILLGVGSIIAYISGGYSAKLDFEGVVRMFKPYLSFIFLSTSILVTTYLPAEFNKHTGEGPNTGKFEVNEKGELRIFDHITEIEAFAFEYRTDIKKIYIPANITTIHESAFFGCNAVTKIQCDHYEGEVNWSPAWKEGCDAKVFWKLPHVDYPDHIAPQAAEPAVAYAAPTVFVAYTPARASAPGSYAAPNSYPQQNNYAPPVPNNYGAPNSYPQQSNYATPAPNGYGAPNGYSAPGNYPPPASVNYGAPNSYPQQNNYAPPAPGNYETPNGYPAHGNYAPQTPANYEVPNSYVAPNNYAAPTNNYEEPIAYTNQDNYSAPVSDNYVYSNEYVAPGNYVECEEPTLYAAPDNSNINNN